MRLRPSTYTDEIAQTICRRIAEGESVSRICADPDMPNASTVREWERTDRNGFAALYARAREAQADLYFDEVCDIADGAAEAAAALADEAADREVDPKRAAEAYRRVYSEEIQARKLRIDSRKWMLARMNRAKYGDRVEQAGSVEVVYRIHRGPKPE